MVTGQHAVWVIGLVLGMAYIGGCNRNRSEPAVKKPSTQGQLASRFAAAKEITTVSEKDEAMSVIALDAGALGDHQMVLDALQNIARTELRDETASKSALRLAAAGEGNGANAVAVTIRGIVLRNGTLKKLAQGK